MYDVDYIPESWRTLFFMNPMTPIIVVYHDILYNKQIPETLHMLQSGAVSVIILVIGFLIFTKLDKNFAEEM